MSGLDKALAAIALIDWFEMMLFALLALVGAVCAAVVMGAFA